MEKRLFAGYLLRTKQSFQVFFHRAQWLKGRPRLKKQDNDYAWVTRDELKDYLSPHLYNFIRPVISEW